MDYIANLSILGKDVPQSASTNTMDMDYVKMRKKTLKEQHGLDLKLFVNDTELN